MFIANYIWDYYTHAYYRCQIKTFWILEVSEHLHSGACMCAQPIQDAVCMTSATRDTSGLTYGHSGVAEQEVSTSARLGLMVKVDPGSTLDKKVPPK